MNLQSRSLYPNPHSNTFNTHKLRLLSYQPFVNKWMIQMSKFEENWYDPLLKFATHIIVSMALFSAIAFSAFLLHWMEQHNLDTI